MRGALREYEKLVIVLGIIPADAGSTIMVYAIFPPYRDHPRGCGEHGIYDLLLDDAKGSSPRMRGAPDTAADQ